MSSSIQNQIIQILKNEERSISGIKKELENKNVKMHRLTLSGYLNSMVDSEILKVKEIKPSKVYSINQKGTVTMYRKIGKTVKELYSEHQGDHCLSFLYYLFNRPIFVRELEMCDTDLPKNYKKSFSSKKTQFIKLFQESGIEIPENDMLIEPESVNNIYLLREFRALILEQMSTIRENPIVDDDQKTLEDV